MLAVATLLSALFFAPALGTSFIRGRVFVTALDSTRYNSVTVPYFNRLFTVSKNETHLQIDTLDKEMKNWSKLCIIDVNNTKNHIVGRIQAAISEDTIAVLDADSSEIVGNIRRTNYSVTLAQRESCDYQLLSLPVFKAPVDNTLLQPTIVHEVYRYDIFYSNEDCSPCAVYGNDTFKPQEQLKMETMKPSKPIWVRESRVVHNDFGIIYVNNYVNGKAVVKFLSSSYEVIKKKYFPHPLDAVERYSHFGRELTYVVFCYGKGTPDVYCGQMDENLQVKFLTRIDILENHIVTGITIKFQTEGNTFIAISQSPFEPSSDPHKVSIYYLDVRGKSPVHIYHKAIDQKYQSVELDSWINRKGSEERYCLYIRGIEKPDDFNVREIIKCLDYPLFEKVLPFRQQI